MGPSRITLSARGRRIAVGFDSPEPFDILMSRIPPGARVVESTTPIPPERFWKISGTGPFSVTVDDSLLGLVGLPEQAVEVLLSDIELWLAEHARGRIFVHAGCVAVGGRAIVLPGRSLAGKSTLTAALVRAGAVYYSDEYAVLSPSGRVYPYARPLAMRPRADEPQGPSQRVPVAQLGGRAARVSAAVAIVALLTYRAGNGFEVTALGPGRTVLGMLDNTIPARTRPRAAINALANAAEGARGLSGIRGDADEAADLLLAELDT